MSGYVQARIWPANDGSENDSTYPVIPVANTTSPAALVSAPKLSPSNAVPSCSTNFISILRLAEARSGCFAQVWANQKITAGWAFAVIPIEESLKAKYTPVPQKSQIVGKQSRPPTASAGDG